MITSGTVEVYKSVLPGRRQRLATIEAPTVVGEMGLLTEPRAAASVEAMTMVEAHGVGRDRLLEMLDADSPAACKLVYEIGRTAERMAATNETVAEVISRLENTAGRSGRYRRLPGPAHPGLELLEHQHQAKPEGRRVLIPWHRHLVEHLPVGAAIRALLGQLALHAVAAVRTRPVEGLGLALHLVRIVGHSHSSSVSGEAIMALTPCETPSSTSSRAAAPGGSCPLTCLRGFRHCQNLADSPPISTGHRNAK